MEIPVTFADRPSIKDSLSVIEKLGEGKFSVYHVSSPSRRASYSLKVFPKNEYGAAQYKKEKIITRLSHPNVIQHIPIQCHSPRFYGLTTELAKHGDFFDTVTSGALSTETIVRTYFHQLITGLEYLHSQEVAHLDLKLENLMLGSQYTLKIIDFDQAQSTKDGRMTSGGTTGYRAPEVVNGTCRKLAAADIYSAGIILFAFLAREFPFLESEHSDPSDRKSYAYYQANNSAFWSEKAQQKDKADYFSQDFIKLVNGMLAADPAKRFKLKDVKESKWFKGPVLSAETLMAEMHAKKAKKTN